MPYADINNIRMYFEEHGSGQPLVLLHGGLGSIDATSAWGPLLSALAARYHAVCVEHRGHGRTNNPDGRLSYALIADDISDFIEQRGFGPAHIAGVSDGGIVGLALAMKRHELVRSLVCVGANYCVDDHLRDAIGILDPAILESEHPEYARVFAACHDQHHYPGYWREVGRQVRGTSKPEPEWPEPDLRRIPVLTLLIAGETDVVVSLDQTLTMRRAIPGAEMLIVNHAGLDGMANHLVQFSRPRVIEPVMLDFLDR